ncbi:MAG: hypothetical protein K2Y08_04025 [Alphaproteobacteria bacterium]|nr:hypothetical protein [Alphaproteobacteria bacterium]
MFFKKFVFFVVCASLFSTLSKAVPGINETEDEPISQLGSSVLAKELKEQKEANSSLSQNQDDMDGFSIEQVQQMEVYIRDPELLLTHLMTDLRMDGKENYAFKKITPLIKSKISKFSPKIARFLLETNTLCKEEEDIIDTIRLFMNYVEAKNDLLTIYTPQKEDSESDYLQKISSKEIKERKEKVQDRYNGGVAFTLFDASKQEYWFRAFYKAATESEESYERAFSNYIKLPLEAVAKCYILTKEPQQGKGVFVNLCKHGFKGKCAAQKKEVLGVWFSKARKNSLPSSSEELQNSEEVFHLNYSSRLKKEYETFDEFLTTYVNALFGDGKDKVILQQKNVLNKMASDKDPEFENIVNFTVKKIAEYIKNNHPAIKVTVKTKRGEKEKYKQLTLHKLFDKSKEIQITTDGIKKEVRKILSHTFF